MGSAPSDILLAAVLFVFGLPIGSFLTVVAYRLPRGETPWSPSRSYCPSCNTQIAARDNIPVLGWLLLRGRCRSCGASISWMYPALELATALLLAAVGLKFGWSIELLPAALLVVTLTVVTATDIETQLIPNAILFVSGCSGVVAMALAYPDEWLTWVLAAVISFVAMLVVALAYPRGMGFGDVKYAAVLGLYLGRAVVPAMFIAFLVGTIIGLGVIAQKGVAAGRKTKIPFGPFMSLGAAIAIFVGDDIVEWYLDTFTRGS
ncbi:MAG: prepilin peptidase [Solirubrobacterales bacterium]